MKTTHYPFIYIAGFFGLGIACSSMLKEYSSIVCLATILSLGMSVRFSHRQWCSTVFLLLAIAGLGVTYTQSRQLVGQDHIQHIARYYRQKPIVLKGIVVSDIQTRKAVNGIKTTFTLDVRSVQSPWGWKKHAGKILVNVFRDLDIAYGDYVRIEGKLHRPYNFSADKNFSYRQYLRHRGIYFLLSVKKNSDIQFLGHDQGNKVKSQALNVRNTLKDILSRHLSKNESGIMKAILLGDRSSIPKHVRTLFVQTGTAHILAISGLHIGIVAGLFLMLVKFIPIGRRWQLGVVIGLLISYAFLTGGRPSVVRATSMMVVLLMSFIFEKEPKALNSLFFASMIILVYNPLNFFDVGFQLSFMCVFSIIYWNMRLGQQPSKTGWFYRWLSQSLCISLAVWIGAAGFIAYYFGIITPITIFANLLVVPFIGIIIALGFGLLLVGIALPPLSVSFAVFLKIALNAMVGLVYLFDKIPCAYFYLKDVTVSHIIAYYALLALGLLNPFGRIWRILRPMLTNA